jgi:hypothetical protein
VLDLLARQGIPALPYKGPVLAAQAYGGRPSLRQFSDLDVLVRREQALPARECLLAGGFQQAWPEPGLSPARLRRHVSAKYNLGLVHPATGVELELHWSLTPAYLGFPPDQEPLWQTSGSITLAGRPMPAFSPEWLVLGLIAHGSNHCWRRLGHIADLAEALRTLTPSALDPATLAELARSSGASRMLHLGLGLARDLLAAPLPAELTAAVQSDLPAQRLAARLAHRFRHAIHHWLGPLEEPRLHLALRERWRDRARYVLAMLAPTSADWRAVSLPEPLSFLYYLVRPVRLAVQHGLALRSRK